MMGKWDKRFYRMAREVASWSKDPTQKVGAVLVSPDKRQVSWGYNGFPAAIEDTDDRLNNKEVKNAYMIHAELNAILNAKKDLKGWTLYVTKFPCTACALAIVQSGISRVVAQRIYDDSSWYANQTAARLIFAQGDIRVREVYAP